VSLNSLGKATFSTSGLSAGSNTITASYGGENDANGVFDTSSGQETPMVKANESSTTVSPFSLSLQSIGSPPVAVDAIGQTITVTATVTGTGNTPPSGTVNFIDSYVNPQFYVDPTQPALKTITTPRPLSSSGTATFITSALPAAGHVITASYPGDTNYTPSDYVVSWAVVDQIAASASPGAPVYGETVTLSATIAPFATAYGPPTGTVTFSDGSKTWPVPLLDSHGNPVGTVSNGMVTVTATTSTLSLGAHAITASYSGNSVFAPTVSTPVAVSVTADTITTITPSDNTPVFGETVTYTATITAVAPASGAPVDGTVTFKVDGTQSIRNVLNGVATLTHVWNQSNATGNHQIDATYNGNDKAREFNRSAAPSLAVTVSQAATDVTLVSSTSSPVYGQVVFLTATVTAKSPGSGTPRGTVTFEDANNTTLGTVYLNSSATAIFASALALVPHTITAVYSGDTNFSTNTSSPVFPTVSKAPVYVGLLPSQNPAPVNTTITFMSTVSAIGGGMGFPTDGTVTFNEIVNGLTKSLGTGSPNNFGVATFATAGLALGNHTITANYGSDTDFKIGNSSALVLSVRGAKSVTATLSATPASPVNGQAVTFTVRERSSTTPTGTVTLQDGSTTLTPKPLDSNGTAAFSMASLSGGNHRITARYDLTSGAFDNLGALVQSADRATILGISLKSSANPAPPLQPIVFTASVSVGARPQGSETPSGNITFLDGGTTMGSCPLPATGTATFTFAKFSLVGKHAITARYNGDTNFYPSTPSTSGSLTETISPSVSVQGISSGGGSGSQMASLLMAAALPSMESGGTSTDSVPFNYAVLGQPFTISLGTGNANDGTPTGTVTFVEGNTRIADSVPLDDSGQAILATNSLSEGDHTITALYSGDDSFAASTSDFTIHLFSSNSPKSFIFNADGGVDPASAGEITTTVNVPGEGLLGLIVNNSETALDPIEVAIDDWGDGIAPSDGDAQVVNLTNYGQNAAPSDALGIIGLHEYASPGTYTVSGHFTAGLTGDWTATVVVEQSDSATTVNSSEAPALYGDAVTLTASVSGIPGIDAPTGTVTFYDGSTSIGIGSLADDSTATFSSSSLGLGNHAITAVYGGDDNFTASTSSAFAEQIMGTASVAVTSSGSVMEPGQAVTFTASVTGDGGMPTGTATFLDGDTVLADSVALDSSGQATFSTTDLAVGSHAIAVTYSGDDYFGSGTSDNAEVDVALSGTRSVLAVSPSSTVYGEPMTLAVAVYGLSADLAPTGIVVFSDGDTPVGSVWIHQGSEGEWDASKFGDLEFSENMGEATWSFAGLAPGSHTITATYLGDDSFDVSDSGAVTETVGQAATSTSVSSAPNSSVYGQGVTFTATINAVSPGAGTPSGTVTFEEGNTTLASGVTLSSGQATFSTASLSVASHTITVSYGGDGNFLASSGDDSAAPQVVNQASSSVVVGSSPNASVYGQTVTFTATISAASPGAGTPTGTVTFKEGSTTLASGVALASGQATFSTASLSVASHTITASYGGDGNFLASSGDDSAAPEVVNQASSSVTVSSSPNASVFGQAVTFTATVAAVSPGAGTPSGTLTFEEGTTTLAATVALNGSAQATFNISSLSVSTHTITALYSGDGNFLASSGDDSAAPEVVNQASSATAVSSSANPAVWGQVVTFTATVSAVSPGAGTPTGTVTFKEGTTTLAATVALNGSARATFTTSSLSVTIHTITASYSGDGNFLTGSGDDSAAPEVVNQASSATAVSSSVNPAAWGQVVTFTATVSAVSPGAGTPTGTVTFKEGATTLAATVALNGSAQATFTISSLSVASHTISAVYNGDGKFLTSSGDNSAAPEVINKASSSTVVSSSPNASVYGQTVTFTATISAVSPGAGTPTGTVNFKEGSTTLASSVALNASAVATFTISTLSVSTHTITANYNGDGDFLTSSASDSAAPQVVNKTSSTTTVSSSANPSVYGQVVTFTATVAAVSPGGGTATGTVTFTEGATTLAATVALNSSAKATFSISSLALGNHTISASYGGDGSFLSSSGSDSGSPQVVNVDSSTTAVTASANPAVWGQVVTFSATVSAASPGSGTPTGTVTFKEGSTTLASGVTLSAGVATYTTSALYVATHTISASYSGDSNFTASSGSDSASPEVVNKASTSTALGSSSSGGGGGPGAALPIGNGWSTGGGGGGGGGGGTTITFIAIVTAVAPGAGTPTGSVTFYDNGSAVGTVTLNSVGKAKIFGSGIPSGDTITAIYSGDSDFLTSTSPDLINAVLGSGVAYSPDQIRSTYGVNDLTLDGTGQTIGIVDAYDNPAIYQALDAFDAQFGATGSGPSLYAQYGPASSFLSVVNQGGQAAPLPAVDPLGPGANNWELESELDIEWAHAMAPGARLVLVEANSQSLGDLMASVATAASQPGVSVVSMSWGFPEGQAVLAQDEATYDSTFNVPGVTFVASTGDYGTADPEYPAFSPNVVAVGGTTLNLNNDGSYGSETGWGYYVGNSSLFIGSGGGVSQFESEPAYQQGVQSTGSRTSPDVAFVADPATGAWVADPYNQDPSQPFVIVGGTSLGAPSWAALIALVNQGRTGAEQPALNSASPTETQEALYSLDQSDYHVIASGTNGGYNAAPGYNLVTGLGTPVANLLVPDMVAGNSPTTGRVAPISPDLNANPGWSGSGGGGTFNAFAATGGDWGAHLVESPISPWLRASSTGAANSNSRNLDVPAPDWRNGMGGSTLGSITFGDSATSLTAGSPGNNAGWASMSDSVATVPLAESATDLLFSDTYGVRQEENSWAGPMPVELLTSFDSPDGYQQARREVLQEI
jgi:hypothetical protein